MDDGIAGRVERLLADLLNDGGGVGCGLGGFEDGCAACCNGADQWANGKLDGEVVGSNEIRYDQPRYFSDLEPVFGYIPNDQDAAQWILSDDWAEKLVGEGDVRSCLILDPLLEVAGDKDAVALAPSGLREVCLEATLAQIFLASFCYRLLVVCETMCGFQSASC